MSSLQQRFSLYDAGEIKIELYARFEVGVVNKSRDDLQQLLCEFLVSVNRISIGPKQIFNALTKGALLKRIKRVKYYHLKIFTDLELERINDTKTNDINGFLMACEFGSLWAIKSIIAANCYQMYYVNSNKSNGLHLACERNNIRIVEFILQNNLNKLVNGKDINCRTPLHCAILAGNIDIVNLLINYINHRKLSAKYLSQKDINGNTPLQCAISVGLGHVFQPAPQPELEDESSTNLFPSSTL